MLEGLLEGIGLALLLRFFHFDVMLLEVFQPLFSVPLTVSHYYVAVALLGIISGAIRRR